MNSFRSRIDADALAAAANIETRDRDALEALLMPAVESHLGDLIAEGRLMPSEDLGERHIHFLVDWDAIVSGSANDWQRLYITNAFVVAAMHIAFFIREPARALDVLARLFDEGTSPTAEDGIFNLIEGTDTMTGERGEIRLAGFVPSFWVMDRGSGYQYRKAERMAPLEPVSATFTAPSGKLLFTDTLRVGSFSEATDFEPDRDYGVLSLNSATGRQARSLAHAAEHNFGFTQTTNTCVAVFQHGATGAIAVTERWNEDLQIDEHGNYKDEIDIAGWRRVGTFSCDMWRVTAIDRQVAAGLIAPGKPEAGEKELGEYLASKGSYADNIVTLPVAPGSRWRMCCGERFSETVDRAALGLPEGLEIWALYEPA